MLLTFFLTFPLFFLSLSIRTINQIQTLPDSPGSQPTTVLLRTAPIQTINQLQTLTHMGLNNNNPSQDYTNPDYQPTTNTDSLRHNQQQSYSGLHQPGRSTNHKTLTHLGHNQQQSFSGLHQPGQSTNCKH